MKRSLTQIFLLVCLTLKMLAISSCANIIPPGGGPRDSLPPRLVMSLPKDSAANVNVLTKSILLTFDEYITLDNVFQNLVVSPNPRVQAMPMATSKLRELTIKLKDTLEPNTTYSFDFGNSIKDVNEGNIARNFTYVFSTGKTVDYNTYSGKVLLAEKGKADSTPFVILHRDLDDTAVFKLSPRYYTKINGKGEFAFHNLPAGKFNVYVVSDPFNKRYSDSTKLFAFRNTPVIIDGHTPRDTLYAFEAFKKPETATAASPNAARKPTGPKEDKRLKFGANLENGQQDLLSPLTLTFNRKLVDFDTTKIVLYDTSYHPVSGYYFSIDTGKTKIRLTYPWKEITYFKLLIGKDAAADSAGTTLSKADTIRFVTKKETDYGSVRIRFPNMDLSKNPVLQIVENDKILESVPLTTKEFQRKRIKPGAYELRILYDTNKNGVWDTGSFKGTKRQPEIVFLIPQQLAIRANWDNEVTITL